MGSGRSTLEFHVPLSCRNRQELFEKGNNTGAERYCSLLPSVLRMNQRHGGYLFFDERGRVFRLRDEEILLQQDAPRQVPRWYGHVLRGPFGVHTVLWYVYVFVFYTHKDGWRRERELYFLLLDLLRETH